MDPWTYIQTKVVRSELERKRRAAAEARLARQARRRRGRGMHDGTVPAGPIGRLRRVATLILVAIGIKG